MGSPRQPLLPRPAAVCHYSGQDKTQAACAQQVCCPGQAHRCVFLEDSGGKGHFGGRCRKHRGRCGGCCSQAWQAGHLPSLNLALCLQGRPYQQQVECTWWGRPDPYTHSLGACRRWALWKRHRQPCSRCSRRVEACSSRSSSCRTGWPQLQPPLLQRLACPRRCSRAWQPPTGGSRGRRCSRCGTRWVAGQTLPCCDCLQQQHVSPSSQDCAAEAEAACSTLGWSGLHSE